MNLEQIHEIGAMIPDEHTECLGEQLTEATIHNVTSLAWYALGYLDALKAVWNKKEPQYLECVEAHNKLAALLRG